MENRHRRLAAVTLWLAYLVTAVHVHGAEKVPVGGTVVFGNTPVCALVLINGQSQFSCDGSGRYDMRVPLDGAGQVNVQAFADGFAPFAQRLSPAQAREYTIRMVRSDSGRPLEVSSRVSGSSTPGRLLVEGTVEANGVPVCALVLANGQQMFSCGNSLGAFSLDVPPDTDGDVSLMVFAAGFQPHSSQLSDGGSPETITYVRKQSTDDFLGWGLTGFYFPQFGATGIVGPKRTDDNMQLFLPQWLEFNFNPVSLTTTFSADKPDCFDDCRGRGVYTRGGQQQLGCLHITQRADRPVRLDRGRTG